MSGASNTIRFGFFLGCALAVSTVFPVGVAVAESLTIDVTRAELAYDQRSGQPLVSFLMTETSKRAFADFTARNVGRTTEFRVDGRVVMRPVIREPITGGSGQIAGHLSADEAKGIATRLASGAAKIEIDVVPDESSGK